MHGQRLPSADGLRVPLLTARLAGAFQISENGASNDAQTLDGPQWLLLFLSPGTLAPHSTTLPPAPSLSPSLARLASSLLSFSVVVASFCAPVPFALDHRIAGLRDSVAESFPSSFEACGQRVLSQPLW